ncbi:MAG: ATP-dependent sacrificial sulfur transferase LarE [Firmicutes bacterium]|nr:ATP-dependent sacrificial sulfur transferase LarE [Bacillota bacterium]
MDLKEFFKLNPKAAIAFSGGVDSTYLLYEAARLGADVKAYYARSAFQPQFEYDDAIDLAKLIGAELSVIPIDVLADRKVTENPPDRCYYCKNAIFSTIAAAAAKDGYSLILDGTNASDDEGDRPGMRALKELRVLSPLRLCGLTKPEIRERLKEAGIPIWNKPAYACLATRIPAGEPITAEKLKISEVAESFLFSLGFTDFRVRYFKGAAKLQLREEQIPKALENRETILNELKKYYTAVTLDLEVRR